jgi:hypothetical protein
MRGFASIFVFLFHVREKGHPVIDGLLAVFRFLTLSCLVLFPKVSVISLVLGIPLLGTVLAIHKVYPAEYGLLAINRRILCFFTGMQLQSIRYGFRLSNARLINYE